MDTTFLITHRSTDLADGPALYQTFKTKKDGCVKVVFHPAREGDAGNVTEGDRVISLA